MYLSRPVFSILAGVILPALGKVTFKMHYNIALLHKKVTKSVTFYRKKNLFDQSKSLKQHNLFEI